MDNRLLEIGVRLEKGMVNTIRWCCRLVCDHPFLVIFLCLLLFLYRSFPFIFSLLVSASPVLVCTAVLLGILLSYGQPNVPEIEIEDRKTDEVVSTKAYVEGLQHASDDTAPLIEESSREVRLSDGEIGEGRSDLGDQNKFGWNEEGIRDMEINENHFASIAEEDEEDDESDDENKEDAESFGSEKVNVDSLDSPPRSPWTRADEAGQDDDLDSDRAESSSPDASMAEIMPMLDELHPLLDEETPQPVPVSLDGSDAESERSSHESDEESESHKGLDVSGDEQKDGEEEQIKSAITWTEEDQKNLMELHSSEIERNQRLENLIMRRAKLDNGIEDHDDVDDGDEDGEDEQTGSPIAWTEEDQKNLMELRSSEIERNRRLENIIMRRARGQEENNQIENHDDEDEEDGQEDKEEQVESPIAWTEEDQKNVMDLGWSEIERNQRLENLIQRRRARKNTSTLPERNFAALESYDLQFNVAPISTRRQNPFDLPDDSELPPIPGSAPSVLLPRRNPFDIPYDSSEEKPDLLGDEFQEEFTMTGKGREPIFRRYESVRARPSRFARQGQEEKEMKMRPYFVPEQTFPEESSYSRFQRQSSEASDSKVSSVPETDSTSSVEDLENRNLLEEEDLLDVETSPGNIEVIIEEYQRQESEPELELETVAEHVRHGSESSEEGSIELGQVEKRDVEEVQAAEYHSISDTIEHRYSSDSSSSSLSEVSERVFIETGGEGLLRNGFAGIPEHTALVTTSTLVTEIPYRPPVYDLTPSSSSTDLHPVSDPVLIKTTVSSIEKEPEGTLQEVALNMLAGSSNVINGNPLLYHDKAVDEQPAKHLDGEQVSPEDVPTTQKLNFSDHDIPSTINSSLSLNSFETTSSRHGVQTIGEEVDEIKDINHLLSELDSIGDFGNNHWGSHSSEFEKHIDSVGESLSSSHHGKTGTTCAVEVNSIEGNKIESAMSPESRTEGIQIEKNVEYVSELETSELNTAENITVSKTKSNDSGDQGLPDGESSQVKAVSKENVENVDSVPEKAELASLGTKILVGDTTVSYQGQVQAKEVEKPVVLEHFGIHTIPMHETCTLQVEESGNRQETSSDPHVAAPVPLENTDGNDKKKLKLNSDDKKVEIKEKVNSLKPEKQAKEVTSPKDEHSTTSTKGKGNKLSEGPSSNSSSSSESSSSNSGKE